MSASDSSSSSSSSSTSSSTPSLPTSSQVPTSHPSVISASDPAFQDAGATHGLDGLGLSADDAKRIQAHMASGGLKKQEGKFVVNRENEDVTFNAGDFSQRATLYIKNCTNCTYVINTESTKILVEGCKNLRLTINKRIITEMLELWNCEDATVSIDTPIKTIQLDTSREVTVAYERRELMDSLVWAGIDGLHITVGSGEYQKRLDTSVAQMKETQPDLNERTDQYIVRFVKNRLVQELIVRLANGYPTTEREADAFDEKKARNDKRYEDYIRKMIKSKEIEKGLDMSGDGTSTSTSSSTKKVPRNGPCPCGSGKKYKKCCDGK